MPFPPPTVDATKMPCGHRRCRCLLRELVYRRRGVRFLPAATDDWKGRTMRKVLGIAILASALGAAPAIAQSTPDQMKPQPKPKTTASPKTSSQNPATEKTAGTSGTLARSDHNFVNEAAIGGMAEVELGNLAKEKASNPDVKSFGERMASDHGKA